MNTQEILKTLPESWDDLKLSQFMKLCEIEIVEKDEFGGLFIGADNSLRVLSVLTGIAVDEFENMQMGTLAKLTNKIDFLQTEPKPRKLSLIKWRTLDEISYNSFITYQTFANNPFPNLHLIIKTFSKNEMTDDEVLNLSTAEVLSGFFILRKQIRKFYKRTRAFLRRMLIKQLIMETLQHIKAKFSKRRH